MAVVGLLLGCFFFVGLLAVGGVGAWWWWSTQDGAPVVAGGPNAPSSSPTTAATSTTPASADLGALAGTWSIDPQDPSYDPNDSSGQGIPFTMEGGRLVARSPEGDQGELRLLSRQGDDLRGEYEEGSTKQPVTGRVDGDRMTLTVEGESITFRRDGGGATVIGPQTVSTPDAPDVGWQPEDPPAPDFLPVFEDVGDVDGDGSDERVMVVAEDQTALSDPTRSAPRRLVVVKADGTVAFQTDVFREPFRPDLNELADGQENYAGVHVVPRGGPYADIRLVFAPASGNFVVFRYDGSTYQVVESGD